MIFVKNICEHYNIIKNHNFYIVFLDLTFGNDTTGAIFIFRSPLSILNLF